MPVYEYVCQSCGGQFDQLVRSLDAADAVTCDSCASPNVRRLISSFAMVGGLDEPMAPRASSGGCCGGGGGCACGN